MTFGEASSSFFWRGYYDQYNWDDPPRTMDMCGQIDWWSTYCMGGEL